MTHRHAWLTFITMCFACACTSQREGRASTPASVTQVAPSAPAPDATAAAPAPAVDSAYGVVPGRRVIANNTATFLREPGYPAGVFAVPLPNRAQLLAFDVNSNIAAICGRLEQPPFELPDGNVRYARFRCPGTWDSRDVIFLDAVAFLPSRGEQLEWTALAGPSPLPTVKPIADLHDYAAIARPGLLNDRLLVSAAWFSGTYLPVKEHDELRGDSIAFGHYQLLDRALFIGDSPQQPSTYLYRVTAPTEVREGLDWAFLPRNASEKTWATMSVLYEVPTGYLVRISMSHDHEGFGVDESTELYAYETGRWRLLARAEKTKLY